MILIYLPAYTDNLKTSATGGTGYFPVSVSKAMTPSEKVSEDTKTGGRTAILVLAPAVSCLPHGCAVTVRALSWVSEAATPSGPSSASRR